MARVLQWALSETRSYLDEYSCKSWLPIEDARDGVESLAVRPGAVEAATEVARAVSENDVVIFVKEGMSYEYET